jgi:diacylglycerol kinase
MNYLQFTTADSTVLLIVAILLGIFFIISTIAVILIVRILSSINRVVDKAERVVNSVESAAEVLKDVGGKAAIFKLVKNIFDLTQRKK